MERRLVHRDGVEDAGILRIGERVADVDRVEADLRADVPGGDGLDLLPAESLEDEEFRISRPRQVYTGPDRRDLIDLDRR